MNSLLGHIKRILVHKYWVFVYCKRYGIVWRGIKHDISKFHPIELLESIKYFDPKTSPIPLCKADKGYSLAWLHHKGHNDHHYEYWVDNLDSGGTPIKMTFECVLEMIADWMAAGKAYNGKSFTVLDEIEWFNKFVERNPKIHKETILLIDSILWYEEHLLKNPQDSNLTKEFLKCLKYCY